MPNRLSAEKSPYLLQHANNPVDWYAWGPEAFQKSRFENKPIFLSIGYSTCHWCHVMERESFESEAIAAILNKFFVPVKVDREERPDVDRIYMLFVQATTGGGGWPMSVWLTPDLKPFYGGTYFPPDNRYGRPGFGAILEHIAGVWRDDQVKVVESGDNLMIQLRGHAAVSGEPGRVGNETYEALYSHFRRTFDKGDGGFGGAPKFPRPVSLNFLFRWFYRTRNEEALDMAMATLRAMAAGGMYDQLGGGFHRYSVDSHWLVPHFEKMLYDQGQLIVSYLEAFQLTGEAHFARIARESLDYVLRDMTSPEGPFYCAEDADSVLDPAHPHEKGEGAFYIFTQKEIDAALEQPHAAWFIYHYGVEQDGNVQEDPHHEFTGRNILFIDHPVDRVAEFFKVPAAEIVASLANSKQKMLAVRAPRVRPHLDDKLLTAWNGLMISAFALAGRCLGEARYTAAAEGAVRFFRTRMFNEETKILLRRFRDGDAGIPGFLDDYAFLACALIDLYETTFDFGHIQFAEKLAERLIELFEDTEEGGFFATAVGDPSLLLRMKEDYDGAEPSGNSMAILGLLRLAAYTGRLEFRKSAERALAAFAHRMKAGSPGMPQMVVAAMAAESAPRQVVLAGEDLRALNSVVGKHFAPFQIVFALDSAHSREYWTRMHPELASMHPIEGKPTAYVCQNFACQLPVTDTAALEASLQ